MCHTAKAFELRFVCVVHILWNPDVWDFQKVVHWTMLNKCFREVQKHLHPNWMTPARRGPDCLSGCSWCARGRRCVPYCDRNWTNDIGRLIFWCSVGSLVQNDYLPSWQEENNKNFIGVFGGLTNFQTLKTVFEQRPIAFQAQRMRIALENSSRLN